MPEARILLVEDDGLQRSLLTQMLTGAGYDVVAASEPSGALAAFASGPAPDLVLSDWRLAGGGDGLALLRELRERAPGVAFVLITAYGTIAHAIEAVRLGVDDYLAKPFERAALLLALERTLRSRRLASENDRLRAQLGERDRLLDLIGRSPAMQTVHRLLERIAPTDATVLVEGESGTGKELAARALHRLSPRDRGPFVAVDCAAIPFALLEAELFGARRGAFTGAHGDRRGRFVEAGGGTLFLDGIGELPLEVQPKLLRVLEQRRVRPLGASEDEAVDVRIVVATNRDLQKEVAAGRFREDLYYRLSVFRVTLPPLRERRDDIPLLVEHFVESAARRHRVAKPTIPAGLRRRLLDHPWPGNVRELANTIERLVLLAEAGVAKASDLPSGFAGAAPAATTDAFVLPVGGARWDEIEKSLLTQALALANGNRKRAAALLDLPYKAFLYRLEKFGILGETRGPEPEPDVPSAPDSLTNQTSLEDRP